MYCGTVSGLLEGEEEGDMGLWFAGRNPYTFGAYLRVSFFKKVKEMIHLSCMLSCDNSSLLGQVIAGGYWGTPRPPPNPPTLLLLQMDDKKLNELFTMMTDNICSAIR